MNRTTTVIVVALIAGIGLTTLVYAIPEQRTLAWRVFVGCGDFFGSATGVCCCCFGCGLGWRCGWHDYDSLPSFICYF